MPNPNMKGAVERIHGETTRRVRARAAALGDAANNVPKKAVVQPMRSKLSIPFKTNSKSPPPTASDLMAMLTRGRMSEATIDAMLGVGGVPIITVDIDPVTRAVTKWRLGVRIGPGAGEIAVADADLD